MLPKKQYAGHNKKKPSRPKLTAFQRHRRLARRLPVLRAHHDVRRPRREKLGRRRWRSERGRKSRLPVGPVDAQQVRGDEADHQGRGQVVPAEVLLLDVAGRRGEHGLDQRQSQHRAVDLKKCLGHGVLSLVRLLETGVRLHLRQELTIS